jgi:hypothetical protein
MIRSTLRCGLGVFGLGFAFVACGSSGGGLDDSLYLAIGDGPGGARAPDASASVFASSDAGPSSCVASGVETKLTPVELAFIFDRSGSMGEDQKWDSVTAALREFFADANSTGLSASLQYFPLDADECSVSDYQTPEVAMRALPDPVAFDASMARHDPAGGTPTLPALRGAIEYASARAAQNPSDKVLVVLVTDGEPNDCSSDVGNVSAAASNGLARGVPSYVIGVGGSLSNLDAIAQGGGTQKAILVSTGNPGQAKDELQKALQAIRGQAMCELAIPDPGAGKALDFDTVNVAFTPRGAPKETLSYDKDCAGGAGWHYDDPSKPTKIRLCATSCAAIQNASGGKVEVSVGCATQGGVR